MAKITLFGVLSNIQILFHTFLKGKKVGMDDQGNIYYRSKPRRGGEHGIAGRERRWVIYKDAPDASKIPAEWHGWLHHQTNEMPTTTSRYRKPWQKPHQPNLTGTDGAYLPPGARPGGHRPPATGDYTAWTPPQ